LTGDVVEINIIDDTSRRDCDIDCGTDWSSQEAVILADRQIKSRFGTETRLEYIDLSRTTPDHRAAQWRQAIKERSLSVPLLLINGRLRVAGQFDTRQIIDAVEVEMELRT
jgi:disulfide oxidoreductase YuzD